MKWEYLVENGVDWSPSDAVALLNNRGAEGWELVAVMYRKGAPPLMYFKRPISDQRVPR